MLSNLSLIKKLITMAPLYVAPTADDSVKAFTCSYCGAFSKMENNQLFYFLPGTHAGSFFFSNRSRSVPSFATRSNLYARTCDCCEATHLFIKGIGVKEGILIYPQKTTAPPAQEDMPEDILTIYQEAAAIVSISPSAACVLIRKALEILLARFTKETNLSKMINTLAKEHQWIDKYKALLEAVRLIGNDAAHPRELNRADNQKTATYLFQFLNRCVNHLISQPLKDEQFLQQNNIIQPVQ